MKRRERRKRARKERKAREKIECEERRARENEEWRKRPMTDAEERRAWFKFANLSNRGFKFGFVPTGIVVDAPTPEEFGKNVDAELAKITRKLPEE